MTLIARRSILMLTATALLGLSCADADLVGDAPPESASEAPGSPSPEPSPEPSPAPTTERAQLEDGRHFVFAVEVDTPKDEIPRLVLDLAYFLTGEAATQAAKDHGDEYPPPNDYYIVNDNPKLRDVAIAPTARVRYVPEGSCCALVRGDLDAWIDAVNGSNHSDYAGGDVPWWVTVDDGEIVEIEQQWLP